MFFFQKEGKGGFEDCIYSAEEIIGGNRNRDVGIDAKLGEISIRIKHGAGGKAYRPAVWKFRREGETASSSGAVAHDCNVWEEPHLLDKIIGRAITMAIREHHHGA